MLPGIRSVSAEPTNSRKFSFIGDGISENNKQASINARNIKKPQTASSSQKRNNYTQDRSSKDKSILLKGFEEIINEAPLSHTTQSVPSVLEINQISASLQEQIKINQAFNKSRPLSQQAGLNGRVQTFPKKISQPIEEEQNSVMIIFEKKQKIRGPKGVNIKVVEMWIDDTVQEARSDLPINSQSDKQNSFSKTTGNFRKRGEQKKALKEYQLDRKFLIGKGVSKENVDRLYRCLFVYSFGFYQMIEEIFKHTGECPKLVASVWRVYGILLEYCSRSDFVNTVSQLEKEKGILVEGLEEQIQEKQDMYDRLENIEKDKRDELDMQILALRQQQQSLLNEKYQLEEDFKQADQAFNDEVSLRLQFEHKINELHSIHRELLIKHTRLIDELDQVRLENNIIKIETDKYQRENEILKRSEITLMNDKRDLSLKVQEYTTLIEKLQERAINAEGELEEKNKGNNKFSNLFYEEQRKNEDKVFEIKLIQEKVIVMLKTESDNLQRIQELKQKEQYFSDKILEQQDQFNDLQREMHSYQSNIIKLQSQIQLLMDQKIALENQITILQDQIVQKDGEKKKIEQELDYSNHKNSQLEADLEANQHLVKEMKYGRSQLEEEYVKLKLKLVNMQESLSAKGSVNKQLEIKMEEYEQRIIKLTVEFQTFRGETEKEQDWQKQKISRQERELKVKQHETENEVRQVESLNERINELQSTTEQLRDQVIKLQQELREDRFNHSNQSNNLFQLESVVTSEKIRSQDLVTQLSHLSIINETLQRESKTQKVIIKELQENYAHETSTLKKQQAKELERYIHVEYKVHNMKYEDALSKIQQQSEKIVSQKKQIGLHNKVVSEIKNENERQIYQLQQKYEKSQQVLVSLKKHTVNLLKRLLLIDKQNENAKKTIQSLLKEHEDMQVEQLSQLNKHNSLIDSLNDQIKLLEVQLQEKSKQVLVQPAKKSSIHDKEKKGTQESHNSGSGYNYKVNILKPSKNEEKNKENSLTANRSNRNSFSLPPNSQRSDREHDSKDSQDGRGGEKKIGNLLKAGKAQARRSRLLSNSRTHLKDEIVSTPKAGTISMNSQQKIMISNENNESPQQMRKESYQKMIDFEDKIEVKIEQKADTKEYKDNKQVQLGYLFSSSDDQGQKFMSDQNSNSININLLSEEHYMFQSQPTENNNNINADQGEHLFLSKSPRYSNENFQLQQVMEDKQNISEIIQQQSQNQQEQQLLQQIEQLKSQLSQLQKDSDQKSLQPQIQLRQLKNQQQQQESQNDQPQPLKVIKEQDNLQGWSQDSIINQPNQYGSYLQQNGNIPKPSTCIPNKRQRINTSANNNRRQTSSSFYNNNNIHAYRLNQEHSALIQNETIKKIQRQKQKEFGKLFQIASGYYEQPH